MRICSGIVCKKTKQDMGGQDEGILVDGMLYESLVGVYWRTGKAFRFGARVYEIPHFAVTVTVFLFWTNS